MSARMIFARSGLNLWTGMPVFLEILATKFWSGSRRPVSHRVMVALETLSKRARSVLVIGGCWRVRKAVRGWTFVINPVTGSATLLSSGCCVAFPSQQTTGGRYAAKVAIMATDRRSHLFIEEWLRYCGFSDDDAAQKLGVQRETVYRWRTQQHRLNPQKIRRLATLCGIEPGEFWHMPGVPSIDSMLRDAPADIRRMAADIVSRLMKK